MSPPAPPIAPPTTRPALSSSAAAEELSEVNARLRGSLGALERSIEIHDRLTAVAVSGEGREGIARAAEWAPRATAGQSIPLSGDARLVRTASTFVVHGVLSGTSGAPSDYILEQ